MRRLEILVVDDEPSNLDVAGTILTRLGHGVTAAHNGAEAVARCQERRFDVVLMDITMPVMDGVEACNRLRELPLSRDVPIMFVTGSSSSASQKAEIEARGDRYFVKPYRRQQLLAVLTNFLRSKGAIGPDDDLHHPVAAA